MVQKKLTELSLNELEILKIAKVLDLEEKYQKILWKIFTSEKFIEDLLNIENEIKLNYGFLTENYITKNKLKIPAERLARFHIYNPEINQNLNIISIFPSPVSGDLAFITEDAVINIDIKTLDINGNSNDIGNLQYLPNQSSFIHMNVLKHPMYDNSGIEVSSKLPTEYKGKPVLTYFLTIIYNDDVEKENFEISRHENYSTIHLTNLPNGILSSLFNNDLIDNFKTYKYFGKEDGYERLLLKEDSNLEYANNELEIKYKDNENYSIFNIGNRRALLDLQHKNHIYDTFLTWVPVSRKRKTSNQKDFYLEAIKSGDANRINERKLKLRFNSKNNLWHGVTKFTLK